MGGAASWIVCYPADGERTLLGRAVPPRHSSVLRWGGSSREQDSRNHHYMHI